MPASARINDVDIYVDLTRERKLALYSGGELLLDDTELPDDAALDEVLRARGLIVPEGFWERAAQPGFHRYRTRWLEGS